MRPFESHEARYDQSNMVPRTVFGGTADFFTAARAARVSKTFRSYSR